MGLQHVHLLLVITGPYFLLFYYLRKFTAH